MQGACNLGTVTMFGTWNQRLGVFIFVYITLDIFSPLPPGLSPELHITELIG